MAKKKKFVLNPYTGDLMEDGTRSRPFLYEREELGMTPAAFAAAAAGDLRNSAIASQKGGIETQEKQGQLSLVNAARLPKRMTPAQSVYEQIGIKFIDYADKLFWNVEMPKGWKIVPTNHSMWSDIVDEQGRKRGGMFYKAAFYDEDANMFLNVRYNYNAYQEAGTGFYKTVITDAGKPIHEIGKRKDRENDKCDEHVDKANEYLDKHFPDWKNIVAYWDQK